MPNLRDILKFVIKRRERHDAPMTVIAMPKPRKVCSREGGLSKFDGSPFGFFARGIVDGSTPGGRESIPKELVAVGVVLSVSR